MREYDESEAPYFDEPDISDAELDTATDLLRTTEGRVQATQGEGDDHLAEFVSVLWEPHDYALTRHVESWTEDGKKKSKTDFKGTAWHQAKDVVAALDFHKQRVETTLCNLFLGVAPRHGPKGEFDKAWQIRTLRVLWQDIDHCSVDEALERCKAAGLPEPTIVVVSGNGVHLYWVLSEPYIIDDGDQRPVLTEWPDKPDPKTGKKKSRQYIVEPNGEKLYQDCPANRPALSAKAQLAQDVMAGMGSLIGGDTTFDLSRLLRWPGTLNRKDQRNGREPTKCYIHSIDPSNRYSFDQFAKYAEKSPAKKRRETVATVKLPAPKKLTARRRDSLDSLVLECGIAADRSAADWALVCWAIEHGVGQEEVWSAVQGVGKVAEQGRAYFDRTWHKAAGHTREKIYTAAEKRVGRSDGDDDFDGGGTGDDEAMTPAALATLICVDDHFAQDGGGKLYYFNKGRYCPRGAERVKARVKAILTGLSLADQWSSRLATEVVEYVRVDSPMLWDAPPDDVLCVENGLLDVTTRELKPHSPDYLSPVQLPVKYDPAATCPAIEKFVGEVFPSDNQTLAYEIPAYAMLPDISIQKSVLLVGEGGNGKSRYLMMVTALLGRRNVSGVSLHRLESDKFATGRLYGKLANICPDLPSEHLTGTSMFKAIVGGDIIVGEEKYFSSFEFKVFAKLLFSANNPPRANDASEGFFDRWLVAKCDRRFRGEVGVEIPAKVLDAILSEPGELSGLLNKALDVLPALRKRGRFTESDSTSAAFNEFHATTDPMAVWLDGATLEEPDAIVLKDSLHAAYCRYTAKRGLASMTNKAFGMKLKKLRPNIDDGQRKVGGKDRQHVWLGIGLRSEQRPSLAQQCHGSNGSNGIHPISSYRTREKNTLGEEDLFSSEMSGEEANPVTSVTDVTESWEEAVNWD